MFDFAFEIVARVKKFRGCASKANAGRRTGGDDVACFEGHAARENGDDVGKVENHVAGVVLLFGEAVDTAGQI